jgi:hypothetical protein
MWLDHTAQGFLEPIRQVDGDAMPAEKVGCFCPNRQL